MLSDVRTIPSQKQAPRLAWVGNQVYNTAQWLFLFLFIFLMGETELWWKSTIMRLNSRASNEAHLHGQTHTTSPLI